MVLGFSDVRLHMPDYFIDLTIFVNVFLVLPDLLGRLLTVGGVHLLYLFVTTLWVFTLLFPKHLVLLLKFPSYIFH
jgi:hypothetical protein